MFEVESRHRRRNVWFFPERGDVRPEGRLRRDGELDGMQEFDGQIEKMVRAGVIDREVGLTYAINAGNLLLQLTEFGGEPAAAIPIP